VGARSQRLSREYGIYKGLSATQKLRLRRSHVSEVTTRLEKRKMKKNHRSQSLHLAFRVRSPRNQLYLGEDRFNSMAVNLAKEKQHTGSRRARFKQHFHQF